VWMGLAPAVGILLPRLRTVAARWMASARARSDARRPRTRDADQRL